MSLQNISTRKTAQTQQASPDQVANNAGGYVHQLDIWGRLDRFLILGVDGGTYYVNERDHAWDNYSALQACLDADGFRTVARIVEISIEGRAPKQDAAIFALAVASAHSNPHVRSMATAHIDNVCRTGTHLFQYLAFVKNFRGWGRALKTAVGHWYESKDPDRLSLQVIKYRNRHGYTHGDALRLAHPKAPTEWHAKIYDFALDRPQDGSNGRLIDGFLAVQGATPEEAVGLIDEYSLPWEALTTEQQGSGKVWEQLIVTDNLPYTATLRNLRRLGKHDLLKPNSTTLGLVTGKLTNAEAIVKARVHPIAILRALSALDRETLQTMSADVKDSLETAFELAFVNVEPAGKRTLLGIDVSGSMAGRGWGYNVNVNRAPEPTPRELAAAMAMITKRTEPACETFGFSTSFMDLQIGRKDTLAHVLNKTSGLPFAGTDCSLPMTFALENKIEVDTFCVYTDNETWAGRIHPDQALRLYREKMGIPARLVVVGVTATEFTIADPKDAGMLDVAGFDTATPKVIADFSAGRI